MGMNPVSESQNATRITTATTTTLHTGSSSILGVFVASSTAGTITVLDGANTIVGVFTAVAATWYPLPFNCGTSLIVTTGGTIDCTVSWH